MFYLKVFLLIFTINIATADYDANWDSLDSRPLPEWFDKAKIGIFVHWGIFSVPSMGTEWFWTFWNDGGEVTDYLQKYFPPDFSYQEFAKDFTAEFFDPAEWADLFAKAGAKYVVLTSKHHEGFTMWPSEYSYSWNSKDLGPHRDIVGELGDAVRAQNLTYGLYHSLLEWYHPLYLATKNIWTDRRFVDTKAIPELYELVNTYQPAIIWSDGDWEAPDTYWKSTEFIAWLYNESPVKDFVVTNDRWGTDIPCHHGGYYTCNDRYSPKMHHPNTLCRYLCDLDTELQDKKWENAMSLDRLSFGFRRNAKYEDYLSIDELLTTVIQTVAYGGNVLINIGPSYDGTIDMIFQERLLQLGDWLAINGEAIYESQPWKTAQKDSVNDQVYYTTRSGYYYAIILNWPGGSSLNKLSLGSVTSVLRENPRSIISLLGYEGTITWSLIDERTVEISLPDLADVGLKYAWVLKINVSS